MNDADFRRFLKVVRRLVIARGRFYVPCLGGALFSFVVDGAYSWSGSLVITGIFEIS